ncbi:MAG TPA: zinc ribbon domain-containing protein, partial [Candidatus Acidoferrales bacterium]|nr:zinc ribbon domain-containing protein [Candidatus Acidoferrales bacterium]
MFCNYCGSPNPDDASFCRACGKAIGAHINPPARAEIRPPVPAGPVGPSPAQPQAEPPLPAQPLPQPLPQMQPQPPAARNNKIGLWILVGFAACLVLVIAVAWGFRQNQAAPEQTPVVIPDSAPVQPVQDDLAAQAPPAAAPAPDAPPAQAPPPPAAPQNPIVGQWKTTTLIGDTILTFTDEGRYSIKSALVSDAGVYVFS